MGSSQSSDDGHRGPASFATTQWSVVLAAAAERPEESRAALSELFSRYWYPLYAFARRRGNSADDAADLTQGFLASLLENQFLNAADASRGRFRSYLLTAFQRFLASDHERQTAQRRGGGQAVLSIDVAVGESQYRHEPVDRETPESLFDRRWALAVLEEVVQSLENEYHRKGRQQLFDLCRFSLAGTGHGRDYAALASQLGMTEPALRVAIHRLRQRYRTLLLEAIGQTVDEPEQVTDELNCLMAALRSGRDRSAGA